VVDNNIITVIRRYLGKLPEFGIHPTAAVLFGSFARGDQSEESDIDLLVLAPEFDNLRDRALINAMWKAAIIDYRLEPIACGNREWNSDDRRPIVEIAKREGLLIPV